MLVLRRNIGESVVIKVPPSSTVTEISVHCSQICNQHSARLGFIAPGQVTIHREEIQRVIDAEEISYDPTIGEDYA